MIRTAKLAVVLMAVFLVVGCGGSGAQGSSESPDGEEAADFAATTLQGDEFNLTDKRGEVVALFFMAGY